METRLCEYCKLQIGSKPSAFQRHTKVCNLLYSNKEEIFRLYKNNNAISKICQVFSVDCRAMRRFFRQNNIQILASRNKVNHSFFKTTSPEMFWLLGLIASDGCVENANRWSISQSGTEGLLIINYLIELINHTNGIYCSKTNGKDAYSISVSSQEMVGDLGKYGISTRKTHSLDLPDFENEIDFKSFIRGYIDGDGCVGVYKNIKGSQYLSISFVGNEKFINSCVSRLPYSPSSVIKLRGVYDIRYTGEKAVVFGDWLYCNTALYRHYKYLNYIQYLQSHPQPQWSVSNKQYFGVRKKILNSNILKLSKECKIPFQRLYKWKANPKNIKVIGGLYCDIPRSRHVFWND